jgi:hypothetical protein
MHKYFTTEQGTNMQEDFCAILRAIYDFQDMRKKAMIFGFFLD